MNVNWLQKYSLVKSEACTSDLTSFVLLISEFRKPHVLKPTGRNVNQ